MNACIEHWPQDFILSNPIIERVDHATQQIFVDARASHDLCGQRCAGITVGIIHDNRLPWLHYLEREG